jgi:beta-lactamase class A
MVPRLIAALLSLCLLAACGIPDPALDVAGPDATTSATSRPPAPGETPRPGATSTGRLPQAGAVATPQRPSLAGITLDGALEKGLRDLLNDDVGDYAVYVKDLRTGRVAAVNEDKVFYAASLFKISVMYEVFRQRALGTLSFDEKLQVNAYYASFDLGTEATREGDEITIADALRFMMSVSDNTSAVLLQDRVGAGNINSTLEALGARNTGLYPEDLPVSAADIALLLETINAAQELDETASAEMLQLMTSETIDNGIKAGLPPQTVVAHKTGNWDNATHDAAIVFTPRGNYILVVLADRDHENLLTQELSRYVYRYLN